MDTQPVPTDNGGDPPTLAHAGVTKAVCDTCHVVHTWENVPVASFVCECGGTLIITAATGETIEQAIAAAAQQLPERVEPVQPTIPGLRPAFNYEAACKSIMEKRAALRSAEAHAWLIGEKSKAAKKHVDTITDELGKLIDELEERSTDARYESRSADGDAQASARSVAAPDNPGRDSEAGNGAQALHDGGDGAADLSSARQSGSEPDDSHLVIDCSNAGTLALVHRAGADKITLKQVDAWTEEQVVLARFWADEQIKAHANDEPGHHTSVYWPAHVSLAHHGPEIAKHTPKKRTAKVKGTKTGRRRAR